MINNIIETQKIIDDYLNNNNNSYSFESEINDNKTLFYHINNIDKNDNSLSLKLFIKPFVIYTWINDEINNRTLIEIQSKGIKTIHNIMEEVKKSLTLYQEKLLFFKTLEIKFNDIKKLIEENNLKFNKEYITSYLDLILDN